MQGITPAERLLQELGITEPSEIDIEAIAWHVGAEVGYKNLDGCEAYIVGAGDRAIITVNKKSPIPRKRFSIGHELGHWHHHRGFSSICRPNDIYGLTYSKLSPPEIKANRYAADLLMPHYLFQPLAIQCPRVSFEVIEEIAKKFKASLTATAIRLVEYGPDISILICYGSRGRKWFNRGRDVPEQFFPPIEISGDSSALDIQFGEGQRSKQKMVNGNIWFDCRDAERIELYEQSIKVNKNEILTLLVFKDAEMLKYG
jgi:hypothetical protein